MAAIKTEHCVEIRVPLKGGAYVGFGSGYTLGPHWVLTAHHVLFPDKLDDSKPIEITWWDESEDTVKDKQSVARDKITWFHREHDIALIKCNPPYEGVPTAWEQTDQERQSEWRNKKCQSAGFLSNLHNEAGNQRRKTPRGTFALFSEKALKADVDDLNVKLKDDGLWAGFSGSPVFAGGKLVAVVRRVNVGESGAGLVASFISPALDAQGGRDKIRLRDVPEFLVSPDINLWEKRYRELVITSLERHKSLFKDIRNIFQRQFVANAISSESDLADAMKEMPISDVIACFSEVLGRADSATEVMALEYLARIWLTLLVAEQDSITQIVAYKNDPTAEPITMNSVDLEEVDVEGQAANGENRDPLLDIIGGTLRSPRDLTPGNKTGIDEGDRLAARDVSSSYRLKTQTGLEAFTEEDVKDKLEHFVTQESGFSSPIGRDDDAKRGRLITRQLRLDNLSARASAYIRIPAQTDRESALWGIRKEWCPELLMFAVSKNERFRAYLRITFEMACCEPIFVPKPVPFSKFRKLAYYYL